MKNYTKFLTESLPYTLTAILHPGVRRDVEQFLRRLSTVNHGDMFIDKIDERFAAHGYVLEYGDIDFEDLDEGGEVELNIIEVATGRLVDGGNTQLHLSWERLSGALNPENSQNAVAKEYRVKAYLVTVVDENDIDADGEEFDEHHMSEDFKPTEHQKKTMAKLSKLGYKDGGHKDGHKIMANHRSNDVVDYHHIAPDGTTKAHTKNFRTGADTKHEEVSMDEAFKPSEHQARISKRLKKAGWKDAGQHQGNQIMHKKTGQVHNYMHIHPTGKTKLHTKDFQTGKETYHEAAEVKKKVTA